MKNLYDDDLPVEGQPVLEPFQTDLYERGRAAYVGGIKRVIFQAPCGAGKTVIAAQQTLVAHERGKIVLHIVHRRRLVDQMTATLARFGLHASAVMQGRLRWDADILCASRDTLLSMLKDGVPLPKADLLIIDECHTASHLVNDWYLRNCPNAYWTGYTATPVTASGKSLNPPYQALVCAAQPSVLIEAKRLCPVVVFNPDAVGRRRRKGDTVKPAGDPVDHWKKYANGLPTVVFAGTVADSLAICAKYNAAGIRAEHLDASTPDEPGNPDGRDAIFERSRTGATMVICNCGVLIEGVDLPWLACCQLLRGCDSLILWFQSTGRIMRAFAGKKRAVVLDHSAAAHDFGLPDWDQHWTLSDGATNARNHKVPKDKKPTTCPACGAMFVGKPACPECGKVMPKKKRKSILESLAPGDAILTQFDGTQQDNVRADLLERLWKKLLYMGRNGGWSMSKVAVVFGREAGCPPWEANLDAPIPYGQAWKTTSAKDWLTMTAHTERTSA